MFPLPCRSREGTKQLSASCPGGMGAWFSSSPFPGLELNGMTVSGLEVAEVPPPLPLKGTSTDYGTLTENPDLTGSPTPPPPPPHQRVSQGSGTWGRPLFPSTRQELFLLSFLILARLHRARKEVAAVSTRMCVVWGPVSSPWGRTFPGGPRRGGRTPAGGSRGQSCDLGGRCP